MDFLVMEQIELLTSVLINSVLCIGTGWVIMGTQRTKSTNKMYRITKNNCSFVKWKDMRSKVDKINSISGEIRVVALWSESNFVNSISTFSS